MEPEQALENLNQAVGQLALTRQQHLILAKSVEVIREALAHYRAISTPAGRMVMGNPSCAKAEIQAKTRPVKRGK